MIFETIVNYGKVNSKYLTFKPGDANRYPHLNLKLKYSPEIDCFLSLDAKHNALEFLEKDLVIRELMIPSLRRLFIKDMLSMPYSTEEKLKALNDLTNWKTPEFQIETINPESFGWSKKTSLHLVKVNSPFIFPIGLMAKGTDIAIVDQYQSTQGQEIAHAIYHFKEGISKGAENITEIHGGPFFVYALQCLEGRLARRIRQGSSPHRIKFSDYISLRAYAGTKIKEGKYHGVLGILSPPMNLVSSLVDEKILIEALFRGSSEAIERAVDSYLGKGAYEEIYLNYDLFGRLPKIKARGGEKALDLMFDKPLFQSFLSQEEIRKIWENLHLRNEKLIDRLETN